jgi:hypothetical protein
LTCQSDPNRLHPTPTDTPRSAPASCPPSCARRWGWRATARRRGSSTCSATGRRHPTPTSGSPASTPQSPPAPSSATTPAAGASRRSTRPARPSTATSLAPPAGIVIVTRRSKRRRGGGSWSRSPRRAARRRRKRRRRVGAALGWGLGLGFGALGFGWGTPASHTAHIKHDHHHIKRITINCSHHLPPKNITPNRRGRRRRLRGRHRHRRDRPHLGRPGLLAPLRAGLTRGDAQPAQVGGQRGRDRVGAGAAAVYGAGAEEGFRRAGGLLSWAGGLHGWVAGRRLVLWGGGFGDPFTYH